MEEKNPKSVSIVPITTTGLVRVGNSIDITNKIIMEHEDRSVSENFSLVKIGNQEWMTKNLDVNCYLNGDTIPEVQNPVEWANLKTGAWCYYDNNPINGLKYGKLYNWFAINDERGLAPKGWHIPTFDEWMTLTDCLGGANAATKKMKTSSGWKDGEYEWAENGNNESGFSGLPGGYRYTHDAFHSINSLGLWWSSSEHDPDNAWYLSLHFYNNSYTRNNKQVKQYGCSVRCLKD